MRDATLEPVVDVARQKTESAVILAIGCALVGGGLWAGLVNGTPMGFFLYLLLMNVAAHSAPVFLPSSSSGFIKMAAMFGVVAAAFLLWRALGSPRLQGNILSMGLGSIGGIFLGQSLDGQAFRVIARPVARVVAAVAIALCMLGLAVAGPQ